MLPFKTPPRTPDTVDVGDHITGIFEMPRWGSLTVTEDLAYSEALAEAPETSNSRSLMSHVRPKLAHIALLRIMPELEYSAMLEPPLNNSRLQELLTNYLIGEKNGDVPPEPADPKVRPQTGAGNGKGRTKPTAASMPDSPGDGPIGTTGSLLEAS